PTYRTAYTDTPSVPSGVAAAAFREKSSIVSKLLPEALRWKREQPPKTHSTPVPSVADGVALSKPTGGVGCPAMAYALASLEHGVNPESRVSEPVGAPLT